MDQRKYYVVPLKKQVILRIWILAKAESYVLQLEINLAYLQHILQNVIKTLAIIDWAHISNSQISIAIRQL